MNVEIPSAGNFNLYFVEKGRVCSKDVENIFFSLKNQKMSSGTLQPGSPNPPYTILPSTEKRKEIPGKNFELKWDLMGRGMILHLGLFWTKMNSCHVQTFELFAA